MCGADKAESVLGGGASAFGGGASVLGGGASALGGEPSPLDEDEPPEQAASRSGNARAAKILENFEVKSWATHPQWPA